MMLKILSLSVSLVHAIEDKPNLADPARSIERDFLAILISHDAMAANIHLIIR